MRLSLFTLLALCCLLTARSATAADKPVSEARAVWIGGVRNVNWDSTMSALSDAGFNMVFPNFCTGGAAWYPSRVLPNRGERDELAACLAAAHKHGIEVHVWRINWYMSGAPDSFLTRLKAEGRTQLSSEGKPVGQVMVDRGYYRMQDWLCPSQASNRKLEHDAMLELAERYPVDGVHFDYMRYADETLCYCDSCKANFASYSGLDMSVWPTDFAPGGKYHTLYQNWRRELITTEAREIAIDIHHLDPWVCVSLAARSGGTWTRESDAQMWWDWVHEGILDFVCPMDYETDPDKFVAAVIPQLDLVRGQAPFYTGMGVYEMKDYANFEKILALGRGLGQDGFVAFELKGLRPMLAQTGKELTPGKALLPHRAPRVGFLLPETAERTPEGFPVFAAGGKIDFQAVVALKAKLREGLSRVSGDLLLEKITGETVSVLGRVDQDRAARLDFSVVPAEKGRYRLALAGQIALSTGESRPFVVRSFPFEVR